MVRFFLHPKLRPLAVLAAAGLLLFGTGFAFQHSDISRSALEDLIFKINFHRFGWIGVRADVKMHFLTAENRVATCQGKIRYQRLEEKIVLECCNENKELLFALKTKDSEFELYLPARKTLFRGNIFDLEYSETIDTQMKPLELYRALKTMPFTPEQTVVEAISRDEMSVRIYGNNLGKPFLSRRLSATRDGNVKNEIYYSTREEPVISISRFDFDFIENARKEAGRQVLFPKRILIESQKRPVKTELVFDDIRLLWDLADDGWPYELPEDTRILDSESWASKNNA